MTDSSTVERPALGVGNEPQWRRAARTVPVNNLAIGLVLIITFATFWILSPSHSFASTLNLRSMAESGSEILILAVGSTFVLICGEIDLSIGSTLVLSGAIAVKIMVGQQDSLGTAGAIVIGVAVAIACGVLVGLLNGLAVAWLRIPSFVVTLGMLGIALGAAQLLTTGSLSPQVPQVLTSSIGISNVVGIPTVSLIALFVAALGWYALAKTRFGTHCAAIGSNRAAALRAGVHVTKVRIAVFVMMGALAGIAAILDVARFTTISLASHTGDNLEAISAVIIGGTSLFGGRGSIGGTIIGTLIPVVLLSGLVIQGVEPFWQNIAIGIILVAAVGIDQSQRERLSLSSTARHHGDLQSQQYVE